MFSAKAFNYVNVYHIGYHIYIFFPLIFFSI